MACAEIGESYVGCQGGWHCSSNDLENGPWSFDRSDGLRERPARYLRKFARFARRHDHRASIVRKFGPYPSRTRRVRRPCSASAGDVSHVMIRRARRPPSPIFHSRMIATAERAGLASPPVAADKIHRRHHRYAEHAEIRIRSVPRVLGRVRRRLGRPPDFLCMTI